MKTLTQSLLEENKEMKTLTQSLLEENKEMKKRIEQINYQMVINSSQMTQINEAQTNCSISNNRERILFL